MDEAEQIEENEQVEVTEPAGVDESAGAPGADARARLDSIVESLLFAAGAPVSLRRLVQVMNGPATAEVKAAVARLMDAYGNGERGIRLQPVAGGYQFRTAPENAEWVRALLRERPPRLGRAAMETLAIIAYRQPATRAEVEAIRGVDADSALNTLVAKRLIRISGRKEAVGRPLMYATTPEFLEVFGLKDLGELPALKEFGPVAEHEDELNEDEHGGAAAEDPEPSGYRLAARRGEDDPREPGAGERPDGDGAGREGEPVP
jgi:segregation and condensation protein B